MPSDKTQLAAAKRQIKALQKDRTDLASTLNHYRARATKAEQELAEFKSRFDKLLEFRQLLKVE